MIHPYPEALWNECMKICISAPSITSRTIPQFLGKNIFDSYDASTGLCLANEEKMATFPTKYPATEQLAGGGALSSSVFGWDVLKIVEESDNEMQDIAMFYLPGTAGGFPTKRVAGAGPKHVEGWRLKILETGEPRKKEKLMVAIIFEEMIRFKYWRSSESPSGNHNKTCFLSHKFRLWRFPGGGFSVMIFCCFSHASKYGSVVWNRNHE